MEGAKNASNESRNVVQRCFIRFCEYIGRQKYEKNEEFGVLANVFSVAASVCAGFAAFQILIYRECGSCGMILFLTAANFRDFTFFFHAVDFFKFFYNGNFHHFAVNFRGFDAPVTEQSLYCRDV